MKGKFSRWVALMLLAMFFAVLFGGPALAHRLLVLPVEPGRVQVLYDDHSPARQAEVILYDLDQGELVRGQVDEEGYFIYDPKLPVANLVANDGMGHRATWNPDVEPARETPKGPVVMLVIAVMVFVAAFFNYRNSTAKGK